MANEQTAEGAVAWLTIAAHKEQRRESHTEALAHMHCSIISDRGWDVVLAFVARYLEANFICATGNVEFLQQTQNNERRAYLERSCGIVTCHMNIKLSSIEVP
jgi:hypothetical protein